MTQNCFVTSYKECRKRCLLLAANTLPWCSAALRPMGSPSSERQIRKRNTVPFCRTGAGASLDRQRMKISFNTAMKLGEGSFGHACGAYYF
jgi:hypothetical protein